jgi:hypothetical protein
MQTIAGRGGQEGVVVDRLVLDELRADHARGAGLVVEHRGWPRLRAACSMTMRVETSDGPPGG